MISSLLRRLDLRLSSRLHWLAAIFLAVALAVRWPLVTESYLNPDEAWISLLAGAGSIGELWEQAIRTAHPPLFVYLLAAVKQLGDSETLLRLAPLAAGVVFPWLIYLWLERLWSRTAGFVALVLLAFAPALVALSAQVRGYTLLLLWVGTALYALERALAENAPAWMAASGGAMLAAILTEYSAAMFVGPAALYALLRGRTRRLRRVVWAMWLGGYAAGALIYAVLLVNQVLPRLERARTSGEFEIWLAPLFPREGEGPLAVLILGTLGQLRYLFASEAAVPVGIVLSLTGCVLLIRRSAPLAVLLAGPLLLMWLAALARLHPYAGTRHSVPAALFLVSGIAVAADRLAGSRPALVLVLALAPVAAGWGPGAARSRLDMAAENQQKQHLEAALACLDQLVERDRVLLADVETRIVLGHYRAAGRWRPETKHLPSEEQLGRFRVFAARWAFADGAALAADLALYRIRYHPLEDDAVIVIDGGFSSALGELAASALPEGWQLKRRVRFGQGITILELRYRPSGDGPCPSALQR